ncbi:MAG: UDP-glucose/GDP-mannose dehydrogenase family protein [Actinomycetaceae bacterium]|nr:UDP-glucose/GDP-mannose dehydrogenase family protein [Actinomycetaceae bacterium]
MRISVIGAGYLGAVHAAAMAELGHDVVAVDTDSRKVDSLAAGKAPFVEAGLDELLTAHVPSGRLTFTTDYSRTADCQLHFIGVGTPQQEGSNAADLTYVRAALASLLPFLQPGAVIAGKSTVPVGTAGDLEGDVVAAGGVLAWNPEFLREGFAIEDTLAPDRIVYGLSADPERAERARQVLDAAYAPILDGRPCLTMDFATAELVKVAANAFLATKISFINAMSQACDATGADVTRLAEAIGLDDRIGAKFLRAGIGFGGGCLPKDIRALHSRASELGLEQTFDFLASVDAINDSQRERAVATLEELLGGVAGRRIAVLGAAFKPDSDDVRSSPGVAIAEELARRGASVAITDPAALPVLAAQGWDRAELAGDAATAIADSDATFLATEWGEFRRLDPAPLAGLARQAIVLDGRNALDPDAWKAAGWTYRGIGRR